MPYSTGYSKIGGNKYVKPPVFAQQKTGTNPLTGKPFGFNPGMGLDASFQSTQQGGLKDNPNPAGLSGGTKQLLDGSMDFKEDSGPYAKNVLKKTGASGLAAATDSLLSNPTGTIGGPLEATLSPMVQTQQQKPAQQELATSSSAGTAQTQPVISQQVNAQAPHDDVTYENGNINHGGTANWFEPSWSLGQAQAWLAEVAGTAWGGRQPTINELREKMIGLGVPQNQTQDLLDWYFGKNQYEAYVPVENANNTVTPEPPSFKMVSPDGTGQYTIEAFPLDMYNDPEAALHWAELMIEQRHLPFTPQEILQAAGVIDNSKIPGIEEYFNPPAEVTTDPPAGDGTVELDNGTIASIEDLRAFSDWVGSLIENIGADEITATMPWVWDLMENAFLPLWKYANEAQALEYNRAQIPGYSKEAYGGVIQNLANEVGKLQNLGGYVAPSMRGGELDLIRTMLNNPDILNILDLDATQLVELAKLSDPLQTIEDVYTNWLQPGGQFAPPDSTGLMNQLGGVRGRLTDYFNNYKMSDGADITPVDAELEKEWKTWLNDLLAQTGVGENVSIDLSKFMPGITDIQTRLDTVQNLLDQEAKKYDDPNYTKEQVDAVVAPLLAEFNRLQAALESGVTVDGSLQNGQVAGNYSMLASDVQKLIGNAEQTDFANNFKIADAVADPTESNLRTSIGDLLQHRMGYTKNEQGGYDYTGQTGFDTELKTKLRQQALDEVNNQLVQRGIYQSPASLASVERYLSEVDVQEMLYADGKEQSAIDQGIRLSEYISATDDARQKTLIQQSVSEEQVRANRAQELANYRTELESYTKDLDAHYQEWAKIEIARVQTEEQINSWRRADNLKLLELQNTALSTKRGDERTGQRLELDMAKIDSEIKATDYATILALSDGLQGNIQAALDYALESALATEGVNSARYQQVAEWQQAISAFDLQSSLAQETVRQQRAAELSAEIDQMIAAMLDADGEQRDKLAASIAAGVAEMNAGLALNQNTRDAVQGMVDYLLANQAQAIQIFGVNTEAILGQAQAALSFMQTHYGTRLGEMDAITSASGQDFNQYITGLLTEEQLTRSREGAELEQINALMNLLGLDPLAAGQSIVDVLGRTSASEADKVTDSADAFGSALKNLLGY